MKTLLIYLFGIITGYILTITYAPSFNDSESFDIIGLDILEEPGECMDYSQFVVFQVVESGCALAFADNTFDTEVFIIPNKNQQFYDNQKIILKKNECAQHVGTYKYKTKTEIDKTIPVIKIIDGIKLPKTDTPATDKKNIGKTLFEKPGDCVSKKNFEVQEVLDSGDAIALEIKESFSGHIITTDLEVLIQAKESSNFYNKQIVKAPKGTCARHIGNYKYQKYANKKVIPIIAFMK